MTLHLEFGPHEDANFLGGYCEFVCRLPGVGDVVDMHDFFLILHVILLPLEFSSNIRNSFGMSWVFFTVSSVGF